MNRLQRIVERILWDSRLVVAIAVAASIILALVMFYVATVDTVTLVHDALAYAGATGEARDHEHVAIVARVAEIVDGYLFGTIAIIFGLGLYELFISKIDAAEQSPVAPRVLLIRSLDDLKERLAKVVFLILIVRYFEYALQSPIRQPLDLLYLAVGIALVAFALSLTNRGSHGNDAPS